MKLIKTIWMPLLGIIFLFSGYAINWRKDCTQEQLYTLSIKTEDVLAEIDEPLLIEVLLDGNIPGDYRNLKNEIGFILDEFQQKNPLVEFSFSNPIKTYGTDELANLNLSPVPIKVDEGNVNVYPYAKIEYKGETVWFPVIYNEPNLSLEQLPIFSIQKLEYIFVSEFQRLTNTNRQKIGLLVHNEELPENQSMGLINSLGSDYDIIPFLKPLADSTGSLQPNDLKDLKKFDALIAAKPTKAFSDKDKLVLDQYMMHGGRMLWMLETVDAEMDSIFRSGKILAFPRELNLNDFFFNYGVRLLPMLVKDRQGMSITLADGETAGKPSYNYYPFPYFARGLPAEPHPINQSLNGVRFEFANPIELLEETNVKQTVLLATAGNSSLKSALQYVELSEVNMNPEEYTLPPIPLAVLLEGEFQSAYNGRIERTEIKDFKPNTNDGKMILVADGDVGKNQILRGNPLPLGADKYSLRPDNPNQRPITYANADFIKNCMDYLLDNEDLLKIRNKQIDIPLFDQAKLEASKSRWQWLNILLPIGFVFFLGLGFYFYRVKLYK